MIHRSRSPCGTRRETPRSPARESSSGFCACPGRTQKQHYVSKSRRHESCLKWEYNFRVDNAIIQGLSRANRNANTNIANFIRSQRCWSGRQQGWRPDQVQRMMHQVAPICSQTCSPAGWEFTHSPAVFSRFVEEIYLVTCHSKTGQCGRLCSLYCNISTYEGYGYRVMNSYC